MLHVFFFTSCQKRNEIQYERRHKTCTSILMDQNGPYAMAFVLSLQTVTLYNI